MAEAAKCACVKVMAAAAEGSDKPACDADAATDDDDDDEDGADEDEVVGEEDEACDFEVSKLTGAAGANINGAGNAAGCSNGFTNAAVVTAGVREICQAGTCRSCGCIRW